jgi:hypothetical protein
VRPDHQEPCQVRLAIGDCLEQRRKFFHEPCRSRAARCRPQKNAARSCNKY